MSDTKRPGPFARLWASFKCLIHPPRVRFVRQGA